MSGNIYISGESSNNKITITGSGEKNDINLSTKETNNNLATQNNNAKYYSDKALESSNKAKQSAEEAKQSAQVAQDSASSILNDEGFIAVSQNLESVKTVANSIDDVSYVADNAEKIEQIVEDLNNLGDTTNINIVATNIDSVNTTANNINSVNDVADSINSVNDVAYNLTEVLNSKIYSENAKESETRALNYADNASNSSDLAQEWAVSSNLVENIDYSSKYYANQAKTSATTATNQATIATNKANEAISALDSTLDYSRITNCLLEVPQNIKLELVDGVLTLKAGSKVIVPNGFEADGTTPKFDYVTIESDLNITNGSTTAAKRMIWVTLPNSFGTGTIQYCFSGNTSVMNSTTPNTYSTFYNIETNKMYRGDGTTWNERQYSLPVCLVTNDTTAKFTSIDQVFNGFGYIGSTFWADKGVKGLRPNEKNTNGTLKHNEYTTSKILTAPARVSNGCGFVLLYDTGMLSDIGSDRYYEQDNMPFEPYGSYKGWYSPKDNITYSDNGSWIKTNYHAIGKYTTENGKITSIAMKQPFRAVDYNDKQKIVSWGMPDYSAGVDIVINTTGYTAPCDGVVMGEGNQSGAGNRFYYVNGVYVGGDNDGNQTVYIPLSKGDIIKSSGSTGNAVFFPLKGAN